MAARRPARAWGAAIRPKQWKAQQEVDLARGTFIDPKAGEVLVKHFAAQWIADLDIDELSRQNLEMRFRKRVVPHLGKAELAKVKLSTIRAWDRWLRDEGLSDQYRHTLFTNLKAMFAAAKDDNSIPENPCAAKSVKKPKAGKKKIVPWPEEMVWKVQQNLPGSNSLLTYARVLDFDRVSVSGLR